MLTVEGKLLFSKQLLSLHLLCFPVFFLSILGIHFGSFMHTLNILYKVMDLTVCLYLIFVLQFNLLSTVNFLSIPCLNLFVDSLLVQHLFRFSRLNLSFELEHLLFQFHQLYFIPILFILVQLFRLFKFKLL